MKKLKQLLHSNNSKSEKEPEDQVDCLLALLGTGGSGKSSILKRSIDTGGKDYKILIYDILLDPFFCTDFNEGLEFKFEIEENSKKFMELIETHENNPTRTIALEKIWNDKLASVIFELYQDEGLKKELFSKRKHFSFMESIKYFTKQENFERIFQKDLELNDTDIFFTAYKTTGIVTAKYINNPKKRIVDTGGQRTERKKWHSVFNSDNIKSIIGYSISLSEFDQLCHEDGTTNRYFEGLRTFQEIYESELVSDRPLYLIFGQFEVLEEKIKLGVSFSEFVPDYDGDNSNVSSIVEFIVQKYLALDVKKIVIKHYVISARNTQQVHEMLNEIFKQNET